MNYVTCLCVYGIKHTRSFIYNTISETRMFLYDVFALPGCYAAYVDSSLPMFRDSLPVQSSRVRNYSWTEQSDCVTLNVGKQVRIYAV